MMYQLYEAERVKTIAEQREYDVRRGELAAAISRSIRGASQRAHALTGLRPHFSRAGRGVTSGASQFREGRPVEQA